MPPLSRLPAARGIVPVVDESWRENDGLVNTLSETVPAGEPSKLLDREDIERGIWNIFPVVDGDHMWLQGGLLHRHNIRPFYLDLLTMISRIPAVSASDSL